MAACTSGTSHSNVSNELRRDCAWPSDHIRWIGSLNTRFQLNPMESARLEVVQRCPDTSSAGSYKHEGPLREALKVVLLEKAKSGGFSGANRLAQHPS